MGFLSLPSKHFVVDLCQGSLTCGHVRIRYCGYLLPEGSLFALYVFSYALLLTQFTNSLQLPESQWATSPTCQQSSWTSSMSIASTTALRNTTSTSFPYLKRRARIRMSRTLPAWRCRPSTRKWEPNTTPNTRLCATICCLDCSREPSRLASL